MDQDRERFKISRLEDSPETDFQTDADDLRIEKLSRRITVISILIPFLVSIALVLTYLDIKRRVFSTRTTGVMGVQTLAKDLESRFSTLSLKQAKLEDMISKQANSNVQSSASSQIRIKKLEETLKTKSDKKEISALKKEISALSKKDSKRSAQINSIQDSVQEQVNALSKQFDAFDEELAKNILLMSEQIKEQKKTLVTFKKTVESMLSEKITKEDLALSFGIERLSHRQYVKEETSLLNEKINSLQKEVEALSKRIDAVGTSVKASKKKRTAVPKSTPAPASSVKKSENPTASGKILEQDIE